jgi:hypothetical protein
VQITFRPCVEDGFAFFRAIKQWPFPWFKIALLMFPSALLIVSASQILRNHLLIFRFYNQLSGNADLNQMLPATLSFPIFDVLINSFLLFISCFLMCWNGLIVPKRAFNSSEEAERFLDYARAQHQKAHAATLIIAQP